MNIDRINDVVSLEKNDIAALFEPFDASAEILRFSIKDSMSNTGCQVETTNGTYFLKIYSNTTDKIECAAYSHLEDEVSVPRLLYYDGSKKRFPFAYTITEFIDGMPFSRFMRDRVLYPVEKAYEIGGMCAALHKRKYETDALLDGKLNVSEKLPRTRDRILRLLDGKPSKHLMSATVEKLRLFIADNPSLFDKIEAEIALCHGDLGYGNILVQDNRLYLIDFEFVHADSIYYDIGHFFRRKDADVEALIDERVYNAFRDGYNSAADAPLQGDWLKLARLCDICAMLCLLNYDKVPAEWIEDIEADILSAIR